MPAVLSLGEILVDWVCTTPGAELDRAQLFTKAPGGAPANVAVGLARLGVKTGFIGRISDDAFGHWLRNVLLDDGVNIDGVIMDPQAQTRMAYVVTTITGDRKLAEFSKISCADARLEAGDLKPHLFAQASVLHFGSISLISSPCAEATRQAVELAHINKLMVSYDPNVRLGLWPSAQACRTKILETLPWADMVKINVDELEFLTESRELEAAEQLRLEHDIPLLIVTLDSKGAYLACRTGSRQVPGFQVQLVEATGAGDGFTAGVIAGLLPHLEGQSDRRVKLQSMTVEELASIISRANAVGALTCTKAGAIPALPTSEEVEQFLEQMLAAS
jgi:sugar/nucleoside kinase (ribokinase family)